MIRRWFLVIFLVGFGIPIAVAQLSEPLEQFTVKPSNTPPATIAGVYLPAEGRAHGTLIFAHGYGQSKERFYGYEYLRRQMGWNLVMFDFREHGESSKSLLSLTTLGHYEQWDLRAVIDWAEARGAAKPYVIYGRSMGASTALLEAANDPRVAGVIASSPFKNAWLATQQITEGRNKWRFAANAVYGLTYQKILEHLDIPTALAKRDDLRLYLICGELDCFPADDARAILDASPSPPGYKQLVVAPGKVHHNVWSWRGDGSVIGHDELIETMLRDVEPRTLPMIETAGSGRVRWWLLAAGSAGIAAFLGVLSRLPLRRRSVG